MYSLLNRKTYHFALFSFYIFMYWKQSLYYSRSLHSQLVSRLEKKFVSYVPCIISLGLCSLAELLPLA